MAETKRNAEEIFSLISRVTDETNSEEEQVHREPFNCLVTLTNHDLTNFLGNVPYERKYAVMDAVRHCLLSIRLFLAVPELIEKNVVGFYCPNAMDYKELRNRYLKGSPWAWKELGFSKIIPTIVTHGPVAEHIRVISVGDQKVDFNATDYDTLFQYAKDQNTDISSLIVLLHITSPHVGANQAILLLPRDTNQQSRYAPVLFSMLDCLILRNEDLTSSAMQEAIQSSYLKEVIVRGMRLPERDKTIQSSRFPTKYVLASSKEALYQRIHETDTAVLHNFYCQVLFTDALSEILWFLGMKKEGFRKRLEEINNALTVAVDDANTRNFLQERRTTLVEEMNRSDQLGKTCEELLDKLRDATRDLQQSFGVTESETEFNNHALEIEQLLSIFYRLSVYYKTQEQTSRYQVMRRWQTMCQNNGGPALSEVIFNDFSGNGQDVENLKALLGCKDPFLMKLLLFYHKELALSNADMIKLIGNVIPPLTPFEHRIRGISYGVWKSMKEQAVEELFTALREGDMEAGEELMKPLYALTPAQKEEAAECGAVGAALEIGKDVALQYQNSTWDAVELFEKAAKFLNIAAAYNKKSAFRALGDLWYQRKNYQQGQSYNECLSMALRYYQRCRKSQKLWERIGELQYYLGSYREAMTSLEKAETADSYYLRGDMYEYGRETSKNRDMALKMYEEAADYGHAEAQVRYERLNAEMEAEKAKTIVTENTYYGSSSYYSSSYYSYYYSSGW